MYAVLDGARDPRIPARVDASISESLSLYAGPLAPELARVAPRLVRLFPDDALCRAILDDGWGQAWGVFLHSEAAPASVCRHLRRLLLVHDAGGQLLVFRWYDPRVLRSYLPTCTREELREVFGPVRAYLLEDDDPAALLRFEFAADDRLVCTRVALASVR